MSTNLLQDKIRKTKCPILVDLSMQPSHIPAKVTEEFPRQADALFHVYSQLLPALKGIVPGVRFSFTQWAMMDALQQLRQMLALATELGFYVLLDAPAARTPWEVKSAAQLLEEGSGYACHGLITDAFIGGDAIKPLVPYCEKGKSVFFMVRTPNKTAPDLQDLITGSRLAHLAAADLVNRFADPIFSNGGYSPMGVLTSATNANAVQGIRSRFKRIFLLVDGLDYPGGNGKNASLGFDRFGHGCVVSVGPEITAAWQKEENGEGDYVALAVKAAERIRNNFTRYFSIL